jgi:hypothetical protein
MAKHYAARMASLKRNKANTKRRIRFKNEAHNKKYRTMAFGSVRNKILKKLLLVDYMIKNSSWIHKELVERYKDHNRYDPELLVRKFGYSGIEENFEPCELMHYLSPVDIMKILGCSRRTAVEYKDALDHIHSAINESMCLCVSGATSMAV